MRSGIADLGERGLSDIAVKTHCTMGILGNKKFFLNLVTRSNLIQKPYYTLLKTFFETVQNLKNFVPIILFA